jgi:S1-C subfamily serine protease
VQLARRGNAATALPLVLAGAAFAIAAYVMWDRFSVNLHKDAAPRAIEPRGSLAEFEQASVSVFEATSPAVVHITSRDVTYEDDWGMYYRERGGTGTGFVWDEDGYIVTNYHVVRDRQSVLVRFADQKEYEAIVVGVRPEQDIAVVKLMARPARLTPIPKIGSSDDLKVGQAVFAIGNPFGYDQTLTTGIISALNRTIRSLLQTPIEGCIQVDAAINPGNSGGPLLDSAGRLIGMNTAIYSPSGASAGIGFAVPVNTINQVVPALIDPQPRLGVFTKAINDAEGRSYVMVEDIVRGSGAEEAGISGPRVRGRHRYYGDVIIEVAGKPIRATTDIAQAISGRKAGDTVKVTVLRGLPFEAERVELAVALK